MSQIKLTVAGLAILAACASNPSTIQRRPLSAAEHYAQAQSRDREADQHAALAEKGNRGAPDTHCVDSGVAEQSTSGGVPISLAMPCWTTRSPADAQSHRAHELRRDARRHRTIARQLIEAERTACDKLPADQRDHSPSWHRDDVVAVTALRDHGEVAGATVVFRKVEGLTASWLREAYACHQAQAAVEGYDPTFMAYCPAGLEGVAIEVVERSDGIAVTMRSPRAEIAAAVLGRATDLIENTR